MILKFDGAAPTINTSYISLKDALNKYNHNTTNPYIKFHNFGYIGNDNPYIEVSIPINCIACSSHHIKQIIKIKETK